jgi:hypothetical protein
MSVAVGGLLEGAGLVSARERASGFASSDRDFDRTFAFAFVSFERDFSDDDFAAEPCMDLEAVFLVRPLRASSFTYSVNIAEAVFLVRPLRASSFPYSVNIARDLPVLLLGVAFFSTEPLFDVSAGESISRRSLMLCCFCVGGLLESLEEPVHLPCFFEGVGTSFWLEARDASGDSPLFSPLSVSGDERSFFGLPLWRCDLLGLDRALRVRFDGVCFDKGFTSATFDASTLFCVSTARSDGDALTCSGATSDVSWNFSFGTLTFTGDTLASDASRVFCFGAVRFDGETLICSRASSDTSGDFFRTLAFTGDALAFSRTTFVTSGLLRFTAGSTLSVAAIEVVVALAEFLLVEDKVLAHGFVLDNAFFA